jgi:hypothetical protein
MYSPAFRNQHKEGQISGFDFYCDSLNADRPFRGPEEIMKREFGNKPKYIGGFIVHCSKVDTISSPSSMRYSLLDRLDQTVNLLFQEQIAFKRTPGYRPAAKRGRLAPEGFFGFECALLYEDCRDPCPIERRSG